MENPSNALILLGLEDSRGYPVLPKPRLAWFAALIDRLGFLGRSTDLRP